MAKADPPGAWIFQVNPKEWNLDGFLRDVKGGNVDPPTLAWPVDEAAQDMKPGDRAFLWRAGDHRTEGIVATGTVTAIATARDEDRADYRKEKFAALYQGERLRAELRIDTVLPKPLFRVKLEWTDGTKELRIFEEEKVATSTLTSEEVDAVDKLIEELIAAGPPQRGRRG